MEIGIRITQLRMKANMIQEELADQLFVSRNLVSKWETGKRRPDYQMIEKIANIFGISTEEIIGKQELLFENSPNVFRME